MELQIQKDANKAGALSISISGELDRESLKHDYWLKASAEDKQNIASATQVTVDLKATKRADTAGLAWLLNLKRDLLTQVEAVKIINVPQKLLNLADLSGAQALLTE